ncbi:EsaB/YukD family protein [Paenilisteria rocourtiae]|uniref:Putative ubiquitin-like protein YukD n=1 Tax=Listeria rocourtiae TaxID=647910 RepID=A0A4R6ZQ92_9LIST|nr:EsaB/YukD family protein [Listeria rocourtiae]EUJ43747.1 hypothetical protein PROCOU_15229 [Listeria rocourtiae FSL F6-920]MBC1436441.1 hypothetical protein [Listeria rocourtiae]MBC1604155.1 hypothetical protein [Listeria rocourtiae]TDR54658.1 putative ubiquitin-like protein YukD [Listeria rocourtiae]
MAQDTHINVTINFTKWGGRVHDLRIPKHQPVKALLLNLVETLKLSQPNMSHCAIKVANKELLLTDDDKLTDFQITDGDIIEIL